MPATTPKQYRFFAGIAHGMKPRNGAIAPSKEVAEEFIKKTSKKKRSEFMRNK